MVVHGQSKGGNPAMIHWLIDTKLKEVIDDDSDSDNDHNHPKPSYDENTKKVIYQAFSGIVPSETLNYNIHMPMPESGLAMTFLQVYSPDLRILSAIIDTHKMKAFDLAHAPGSKEQGIQINLDNFDKNGSQYTEFLLNYITSLEKRIMKTLGFLNRVEIRVRVRDPKDISSYHDALGGGYRRLSTMIER